MSESVATKLIANDFAGLGSIYSPNQILAAGQSASFTLVLDNASENLVIFAASMYAPIPFFPWPAMLYIHVQYAWSKRPPSF